MEADLFHADEQWDSQNEANGRISQFWENRLKRQKIQQP
jgi:hypothetical protein